MYCNLLTLQFAVTVCQLSVCRSVSPSGVHVPVLPARSAVRPLSSYNNLSSVSLFGPSMRRLFRPSLCLPVCMAVSPSVTSVVLSSNLRPTRHDGL